jgi:Ca2+-binding RTX toxin-like protein
MAEFNFTYAAGVTAQQALGFEFAGQIWGKHLNNGAKINIHVGIDSSLNTTRTLGGAIAGFVPKSNYSSFSRSLREESDDQQEIDTKTKLESTTYNFSRNSDGSATQSSDKIDVTRANAKALKIITEDDSKLDGYIVLSSLGGTTGATWSYDYTRSSSIASNQVDFLSTALHEIGHILGFVSSVDRHTSATAPAALTPMDLFRGKTTGTTGNASHYAAYGQTTSFFSDKQAGTILGNFAKGADTTRGGDGAQTSHWTEGQGLMDAYLAKGERANITTRDFQAFDLLGWKIETAGLSTNDYLVKAKDSLAARFGWSIPTLNSKLTSGAFVPSTNRANDLNTLLTDSEVYNWRRPGAPPPPPPTPQELAQLMSSLGLFDTMVDPVELLLESVNRSATDLVTHTGTDRNDNLTGQRKDDLLVGNNGDDRLSGGRGNDVLWGGQGDDQLWGGKGNDVLCGGLGDDQLWGGKGQDIFTLEINSGFDVVADFRDGQDVIKLSSGLELGQLSIVQQGRNTLIQSEGQSLMLLSNVRADRITAADFLA